MFLNSHCFLQYLRSMSYYEYSCISYTLCGIVVSKIRCFPFTCVSQKAPKIVHIINLVLLVKKLLKENIWKYFNKLCLLQTKHSEKEWNIKAVQFSAVQSLSCVQFYVTPWTAFSQLCPVLCDPMNCSTPGLPVYHQLLEFIQTHVHKSVMPSSHLILCLPLLLLPPIPPSIKVFSNESTLRMRWPKYWGFSFTISPSNEHPGLIFRMDWWDLLTVQGTLKSFLQHHSSKASIL